MQKFAVLRIKAGCLERKVQKRRGSKIKPPDKSGGMTERKGKELLLIIIAELVFQFFLAFFHQGASDKQGDKDQGKQ